jgi:hypothetical protein
VLESASHKAQHAERRRIQPLQVLGHHQQRLLGSRVGQQVQVAMASAKGSGGGPAVMPKATRRAACLGSGIRCASGSNG